MKSITDNTYTTDKKNGELVNDSDRTEVISETRVLVPLYPLKNPS